MGFLGYLIIASILFLIPTWRIFARAGLPKLLSLLILIPGFGLIIVPVILAFSDWPNMRKPPGRAARS